MDRVNTAGNGLSAQLVLSLQSVLSARALIWCSEDPVKDEQVTHHSTAEVNTGCVLCSIISIELRRVTDVPSIWQLSAVYVRLGIVRGSHPSIVVTKDAVFHYCRQDVKQLSDVSSAEMFCSCKYGH